MAVQHSFTLAKLNQGRPHGGRLSGCGKRDIKIDPSRAVAYPRGMNPAGRIVIAGGSGFLGLNLARHLAALGCDPVILSRHATPAGAPGRHVTWDARAVGCRNSRHRRGAQTGVSFHVVSV